MVQGANILAGVPNFYNRKHGNLGKVNKPQWANVCLLTYPPNKDSNQHVYQRIPIRILCCPYEEALHPWLPKMRPVQMLIRLRECAG